MADNAEFKALVRRRMEATGEKYTEAYRALLRAAEREVIPAADRTLPLIAARPREGLNANPRSPDTTLIGRRPDNDIVVGDLGVSKVHAELRRSPGSRFTIVDLGSHNGTYVNGIRTDQAELTEGDLIRIGLARFRFSGGELCPDASECPVRVFRREQR